MRNVKCVHCSKGLRRQRKMPHASCDDCQRKKMRIRVKKRYSEKTKKDIEEFNFELEQELCDKCGFDLEDLKEFIYLGLVTTPQKIIGLPLRVRTLSYIYFVHEKNIPINRSHFFERNSLKKIGVKPYCRKKEKTARKCINHYLNALGYDKYAKSYNESGFDVSAALEFGLKGIPKYVALPEDEKECIKKETHKLLMENDISNINAFSLLAAAVYRVSSNMDVKLTQRKIGEAFGVTEVTIRKYVKHDGVFSLVEKIKEDLE